MYRFDVLEKEINKGVKVDEKSNEVISNWSPNNVRRLVIGSKVAVVQYFVTGGRYSRLIEIVALQTAFTKDMASLTTENGKPKSVLGVLTAGRVCSSIEEVVFSLDDYPDALLRVDSDLKILSNTLQGLGSRFPRLRHISITPISVKDIVDSKMLQETQEGGKLLLDALKEKKLPIRTVEEPHEKDWWRSTSLRPRYYTMDADSLSRYFDKVKEKMDKFDKKDVLQKLDEEKDMQALQKAELGLVQVQTVISSLFKEAEKIYDTASIVSKSEWASILDYRSLTRYIRDQFYKNSDLVESISMVDFKRIIDLAEKAPVQDQLVGSIKSLETIFISSVLKSGHQEGVAGEKYGGQKSVQTLQKLTGTLLTLQCNIVFLSFIRYLTRNSVDYVSHFYHQLSDVVDQPLLYTRSMVEYCNRHMPYGQAKQAMDEIGAVEVLSEQYSTVDKVKTASTILKSLSKVV